MTSQEHNWLEKRKKGIGGSDAAAVVGISPYKTNVELWEEKTGKREAEDISDKPYVKYGKKAEKHIRALFKLDYPQYKVNYDEFGMIANNLDLPFCFATLDGDLTEKKTGRKGVLEIKTTEIMNPTQWIYWQDQIPQHYYCQIVHQLLATGYDFSILKAQIKYINKYGSKCATTRHYHIERADAKEDLEYIAEQEKKFWKCVEKNQKPNLILPNI